VRNYKETLKKEVEETYDEVEKKRKEEEKEMVIPTNTFYIIILIADFFFCFEILGMFKVLDNETLK